MAGSKHKKRRVVIHSFQRHFPQGCNHRPGIVLPPIKSVLQLLEGGVAGHGNDGLVLQHGFEPATGQVTNGNTRRDQTGNGCHAVGLDDVTGYRAGLAAPVVEQAG